MGKTKKQLRKQKLKARGFQRGNIPHNQGAKITKGAKTVSTDKKVERLERRVHELVKNKLLPDNDIPQVDKTTTPEIRLLRPKKNPPSVVEEIAETVTKNSPEDATNRVVNVKLNADMWNTVFTEHRRVSPNCNGYLAWDPSGEEKRGFGWIERAHCNQCRYVSRKFKLYEEVNDGIKRRGRKTAKMNIGAQISVMQTPAGFSALRKFCTGTNIPAPSTKGMQKTSKLVSKHIEKQNEADMKVMREKLHHINELRGTPNPTAIDIESDGIYSSKLYSGVGKTPFQPSTQVVYTVAENSTPDRKIIAMKAKSKLCSDQTHHKDQCGDNSSQCSANIKMTDTIGNEKRWVTECLQDLKEDGLEVRYITTDPDTAAYKGAEVFYQQGNSETEPENLIDSRHLAENVRKKIKNDHKLIEMMPGATKAEREKLCSRFAVDLQFRCTAEINQAHKKFAGDIERIKHSLSYCVDAIVQCYQGIHDLCILYSFVCSGGVYNWIVRSSFVRPDFVVAGEDEEETDGKLRACVNLRLGPAVLEKCKFNTNSQKVESANQVIRARAMPRHTTFPAVFSGRSHGAVHSVNHGGPESLAILCKTAGCPIAPGSSVAQILKSEQKIYENKKVYNSTIENVTRKADKRHEMYELYEDLQEQLEYQKGMLLPSEKPENDRKVKRKAEHSYSKPPKSMKITH